MLLPMMLLRGSLGSRRSRNSSLKSVNRLPFFISIRRLVLKSCQSPTTTRIRSLGLFFALLRMYTLRALHLCLHIEEWDCGKISIQIQYMFL